MLTIEGDLNVVTGEVTYSVVEGYLPGRPTVAFVRSYSSRDLSTGQLGYGWQHNLQLTLRRDGEAYFLGGGGAGDDRFEQNPNTGLFTTNSGGYILGFEDYFTLVKSRNGSFWRFEPSPAPPVLRLHSREDIDGNQVRYFYTGTTLNGIQGSSDRLLTFQYDVGGRLVHVRFSHPSLAAEVTLVSYRYDSSGDLVDAADRSGIPIHYEYDRHRLVAITNQKGGRTYFAYDDEGVGVLRWRSDGGRYRLFRRDIARGRVEMTNSRGDRLVSTIDEFQNVTRRVDPLRRIQESVYDPNGGLLMSDMEPAAVPCIAVADEKARTETVICGSKETRITYNDFDKPVQIEGPEGQTQSFRYDDKGHLIETIGANGTPVQVEYSATGEVIAVTDPRGNQTNWTTSGLATRCWDGVGSKGSSRTNAFGDLEWIGDPYGNQTQLAFDGAGRLSETIFPDGGRQRFGYDEAGYPSELQCENGAVVTFESDRFARPTGYTDANGAHYRLEWDSEDNLTRITNPEGRSLQFSYDACDRISQATHYDGRVTLVDSNERDRPIRYRNGISDVEVRQSFNEVGLVAVREATRAPRWEFNYGANGQLLTATSELGEWKQKWSEQGRWIGEDCPNRELDIGRDSLGRRVVLRDSRGLQIDYTWDLRSRLSQMTVNGIWTWKFEYDLRNLIVRALTPGDMILSFSYDSMQRMTERTLRSSEGTVLASRTFQWTPNDDLVRIEDFRLGVRTMAVDAGGRLLSIRGSAIEDYMHDPMGNVLVSAAGDPIGIGSGNHVQSAGDTRFFYNDEGHIAGHISPEGKTEYLYDGNSLLTSVKLPSGEIVENEYDFLSRRTRKVFAGIETTFYWDGQFLQGEQASSDAPVYYITLPESPIPLGLLREGQMQMLLFDQIGTVTEAFDEKGVLAWASDSTAFGLLRTEVGAPSQPIRALGQYHDRETGLYYNWFRHYSPMLGRYISADPIGYRFSQNRYWYSSNPHSWVDYDGLGSLAGGVLTLNWRCDWTKEQKKDFVSKIAAQNDHIDEKGPARVDAAKGYKRPCGSAADKWRDECEENASDAEKERPVKNTHDPCKDNDADHRMELVLGGENECHNMTPCNASVNRSCGSQIGSVLRDPANAGKTISSVEPAKKCTPPSGDTKPCTQNWSEKAKL